MVVVVLEVEAVWVVRVSQVVWLAGIIELDGVVAMV